MDYSIKRKIILALAGIVSVIIIALVIILLLPVVVLWAAIGLFLFIASLIVGLFSILFFRRRKKKTEINEIELPKSKVKIRDL